ncbi:MAG: hypothetical protein LBN11_03670 [Tannerella sp.]|jgi:hypothetical protein|nr:hypothetical protein [Tannerella sp.]
MKRSVSPFVGLLLCCLTFGWLSCVDSRQKQLEKFAGEINLQCPVSPNETMRIDSFIAMPDLTVKMIITLTTFDLSDTTFDKEAASKTAKKAAIKALQENVYFKVSYLSKAKYIFSYYDSKKNHLYDIVITPEEYALPPETINKDAP